MDVCRCLYRLYICLRLDGGDGINVRPTNPVKISVSNSFQGSNQRRSIPLGIGIRTQKATKVSELHNWYGYHVMEFLSKRCSDNN